MEDPRIISALFIFLKMAYYNVLINKLMNLFKEVADIKTADQLNLPTPEVEYHNVVAQPTEHQQEMVKALSERASLVHSGTVDPSQDNMLKIVRC